MGLMLIREKELEKGHTEEIAWIFGDRKKERFPKKAKIDLMSARWQIWWQNGEGVEQEIKGS